MLRRLQKYVLGPTPEKSSLSMTSACEEPFFAGIAAARREVALAFSTVLAARSTESWDKER